MKIGIITHNYPLKKDESKDAGKFVYQFAHKLSSKADVFVLVPQKSGKKEIDNKVPVQWFSWGDDYNKLGTWKFFSPLSLLKFFRLLIIGSRVTNQFVKENKIDYLLCFWNLPSGFFGFYAKKISGVKYATWALGSDIYIYSKLPIVRQITQMILKNADLVLGNSKDINSEIKKLAQVKSQFLPTATQASTKEYKNPNLDKDVFNFLCLGRLEKVKGQDILIEACKILITKDEKFHLNLIGSGTNKTVLEREISSSDLSNHINLLGYIEDQKLINGYLKYSDCLIIPSRSESFPLVITEALQVGLPMIGSQVGDMKTFITTNRLGYTFQKLDADQLAQKMQKMMKIGRKIRKEKRNQMAKLSKEFELESIVNQFLRYV
jgi:glycosyltransferase involved in cell wall biosynthesis